MPHGGLLKYYSPSSDSLTLAHWNINGWTDLNRGLRSAILKALAPDLVALNERHLMGHLLKHLESYVWFGENRMTHIKAPKGFTSL